MKNLTRVLALVIVLAMMMSTVAFASFTDVAADDDYAEAIETLAALGIIKGYEDGTFGADKAITRAEAVAIVNRIQNLGLAASGAAGASLYTDVAADHWALGDINLATQMGVISGDGNGLFRPEDQVSYQEMVKMLTTALGYGPAVAENGGWPTGYLVVAQSKGILDDTVNGGATAANRGVVAQLTFNALTAPIMEQTGYGDDKEFHFMEEGTTHSQFNKTLLDQKLGVYKFAVEAYANDSVALAGQVANPGEVKVAVNDTFGVKIPTDLANTTTWLKADSSLGDQLAYQAVAYVKKNAEKKYEVLYSAVDAIANKTVTVAAADITNVSNGVISTEDADGVKEKFYYDNTASQGGQNPYNCKTDVIVSDSTNGSAFEGDSLTLAAFTYNGTAVLDNEVTFLYNDNDDDIIDYIFIKKYTTDVVAEESHNGKTIVGKQELIKLNKDEDKLLVYTLTLDGEEATPADLQVGDVFSYVKSNNSHSYEIIATRNSVEGTIDAYSSAKGEYTIGGEVYELSQSAPSILTQTAGTTPGVSGTFYLDPFGKIAYFEKSAVNGVAAAANFGLVKKLDLTSTSAWAKAAVEMLKADGTTELITLADKVTITTVSKVNNELTENSLPYTTVTVTNNVPAIDNTVSAALTQCALVDYSVNAAGLLSSITVVANNAIGTRDDIYFTQMAAFAANNDTYKENTEKLGDLVITDNTLVFYAHGNDTTKWKVADKSFFEDGKHYVGATAYCVNTSKEVGAVVVIDQHSTGIVKDNAAVFASIATVKNADGINVSQISYYQDGVIKSLNTTTTTYGTAIKVGTPIVFDITSEGTIDENTIYALTTAGRQDISFGSYVEPVANTNITAHYAFGQVIERSGNTIRLGEFVQNAAPDYDYDWISYNVPETANVYVVDFSGRTPAIGAAAMTDIYKNRYFTVNDNGSTGVNMYDEDTADNFMALIRFNEDCDITDVIVFKNAAGDTTATIGNKTVNIARFNIASIDSDGNGTLDVIAKDYFGQINY